jgi:hypothetical protein
LPCVFLGQNLPFLTFRFLIMLQPGPYQQRNIYYIHFQYRFIYNCYCILLREEVFLKKSLPEYSVSNSSIALTSRL